MVTGGTGLVGQGIKEFVSTDAEVGQIQLLEEQIFFSSASFEALETKNNFPHSSEVFSTEGSSDSRCSTIGALVSSFLRGRFHPSCRTWHRPRSEFEIQVCSRIVGACLCSATAFDMIISVNTKRQSKRRSTFSSAARMEIYGIWTQRRQSSNE